MNPNDPTQEPPLDQFDGHPIIQKALSDFASEIPATPEPVSDTAEPVKTNRQAHEEAAGMNLAPEFFTMNGIDPSAPATTPPIEDAARGILYATVEGRGLVGITARVQKIVDDETAALRREIEEVKAQGEFTATAYGIVKQERNDRQQRLETAQTEIVNLRADLAAAKEEATSFRELSDRTMETNAFIEESLQKARAGLIQAEKWSTLWMDAFNAADKDRDQLRVAIAAEKEENEQLKIANSRLATIANDQCDKTLLAAQLTAAQARADAGEKDAKRLDFLIKNGPPGAAPNDFGLTQEVWEVATGFVHPEVADRKTTDKEAVRAAIDAASEGVGE